MKSDLLFKVGSTVSFNDICDIVPQARGGAGMPYSVERNILFVLSKHGSLYEDEWRDDVLHYTGWGQEGDQTLTRGNEKLANSSTNGYEVHLFEVIGGIYKYRGPVKLVSGPYQKIMPDKNGIDRKVWVFPIKLIDDTSVITEDDLEKIKESQAKIVKKLSYDDLKKKVAKQNIERGSYRKTTTKQYGRDAKLARFTRLSANGVCELCGQPAPFNDKNGEPYLESHHIDWLERGGSDTPDNTAALCPNCHKKMHVVEDSDDVAKLKAIAHKRAKEIGYESNGSNNM